MNMKKISVSRELTFISRFFDKLKYIDPSFTDFPNPVKLHDKDLLKDRIVKRVYRIDEETEKLLFKSFEEYSNPELGQIAVLSLLTSCRRSEIVYLEWNQIHDNYLQLWHTKSGKPRKVYLTKEAQDLIKSIPKVKGQERLFSYTLAGFEGSFDKLKEKIGLKGKFRFRDFRRESISRFVERVGNNGLILSEILGYESVRKLEELHIAPMQMPDVSNQYGIQNHVGHSTGQITKVYFNLKTNIKK